MSGETRSVWREAKNEKPEEYLLLLRHPRNHSRRRGRRAALARTRKASVRRDGETVICTEEPLPDDASIQVITESEVATEEPNAAKGNVRITGSSGQMVCSLLCWLLALILSVLLLRYLYRRSRKCAQGEDAANVNEPFFCPPDFGKTISPNDTGTERCTCCSKQSTTRCASEDPFSSRQSAARNCNVKKLAKKCLPRKKKARKKPPPAPAPPPRRKASRRPARFSECEIREIQDKVAQALRNDAVCCKCDGKGVLPQERAKPRRFKFFRFKKKVSDDFECDGSKKVLFEANTSTKEKSPCSRRTDLRIRNS